MTTYPFYKMFFLINALPGSLLISIGVISRTVICMDMLMHTYYNIFFLTNLYVIISLSQVILCLLKVTCPK